MRSRPNHLRNNQTKSLTLFSPHMLSFPLDDICSKPQVHKLTSPRQYHHFAKSGQCLTGILPRFLSGMRAAVPTCVSDHSGPQAATGCTDYWQNISGKTAYQDERVISKDRMFQYLLKNGTYGSTYYKVEQHIYYINSLILDQILKFHRQNQTIISI